MTCKRRGLSGRILAATMVATGVLVLGATAAFAFINGGAVTIIDPATAKPLNSGTQGTTWSMTLPNDSTGLKAHCSGDSAHGNYKVYGFIIPVSQFNPSTLTFDPLNGPSQGLPLFDINGVQYGPATTAATTGQVINIPNFNYNKYATTDLPAGNYYVGVACATGAGGLDTYWNQQITINSSLGWQASPSNGTPESPLLILLPVSAIAILGIGIVVKRRRAERVPLAA